MDQWIHAHVSVSTPLLLGSAGMLRCIQPSTPGRVTFATELVAAWLPHRRHAPHASHPQLSVICPGMPCLVAWPPASTLSVIGRMNQLTDIGSISEMRCSYSIHLIGDHQGTKHSFWYSSDRCCSRSVDYAQSHARAHLTCLATIPTTLVNARSCIMCNDSTLVHY